MICRQRDLPSAYHVVEPVGFVVEADPDKGFGKIDGWIADEILVTKARKVGQPRKESIRIVPNTPRASSLRRAHPGHEPAAHDCGALLGPPPGVCDGPAVANQMHDAKVRKRKQVQENGVG